VGTEKEKSHSLLSAFFAWNMAEKWILKNPQLDEHWKSFLHLQYLWESKDIMASIKV